MGTQYTHNVISLWIVARNPLKFGESRRRSQVCLHLLAFANHVPLKGHLKALLIVSLDILLAAKLLPTFLVVDF